MTAHANRPAIRYHGSKFRLAPWILQHFPPHTTYVEAFGGSAAVLLQKPRAYSEVYNDLDGDIVNFFRVLQDPENRRRLIETVELTPYARAEFERAWEPATDPIERARRTCIRASMGFGSAGATKGTTGFRVDSNRPYGTAQHNWQNYPLAIARAGERFAGVLIENQPAIRVLFQHDTGTTLHFVDPPYLHGTRVIKPGTSRGYAHEMTDDEHAELLAKLQDLRGMVVVCGYPSDLYNEALRDWTRDETTSRASAQRGTSMRTEVVWMNRACTEVLALTKRSRQQCLLGATAA